jgi:hypothetical protein
MRAIFLFAILFATAVQAEEPVKTPLKDVWAYFMPGTKEVTKLEPLPENVSEKDLSKIHRDSLVTQILAALRGEKPEAAFCVLGTDIEALKAAYNVLVKKAPPQNKFPDDKDATLVFFSYRFGKYVQITSVERTGNSIDIRYRFESHPDQILTSHFALIPLGKLPIGKYGVHLTQEKKEDVVDARTVNEIICKPFSIVVEKGQP